MRAVVVAGLVLFVALSPRTAQAQLGGVRFEITHVADSTFAFPRGQAKWVRPGLSGIAVDPRRRDALVAQFRVLRVDTALVTALITGQTTRVALEHVAILEEPRAPFFRTLRFWGGALVGFALGAMAGAWIQGSS